MQIIHDFHNGGCCAQPGDSCINSSSERPQSFVFVYCTMAFLSNGVRSNSSNALLLTEDDIPGVSLLGQKPEELKTAELRLWLKCRGDLCSGLKKKAELVWSGFTSTSERVDKDVVDPDPYKIYSRRKEGSSTTTNITSEEGVSVQFPIESWSTSLEKMPMFTTLDRNIWMHCHITNTLLIHFWISSQWHLNIWSMEKSTS